MTTDSGPDILVLPSPGTLENHKNTNQDWLSAKQGTEHRSEGAQGNLPDALLAGLDNQEGRASAFPGPNLAAWQLGRGRKETGGARV